LSAMQAVAADFSGCAGKFRCCFFLEQSLNSLSGFPYIKNGS
jgi:hypothetical protein